MEDAREILADARNEELQGENAATPVDGEAMAASNDGSVAASAEAADEFAHGPAGESAHDPARSYSEDSVGLGVDIVEIERMRVILERTPSFAERVFSPAECAYCKKTSNPATHFALRFAAKEAIVKALGTGFAEGIGVRDIEVLRAKSGRPSIKLTGRALEIANARGVRDLSISLSYTHTDAVACALAMTDTAAAAVEKRKDPMEELSRQFKDLRGMLDEL